MIARMVSPVLALSAGIALCACGGSHGDPTANQPLARGFDSNSSLVTESVAPGTAVPFEGGAAAGPTPASREFVTVVRVIDPTNLRLRGLGVRRPASWRYVAVELKIDNTGTLPYRDDPAHEVSLLSESTGGHIGRVLLGMARSPRCPADLARPASVSPGQTKRGCILFAVPSNQRISAVQYQTAKGTGPNIAAWSLGRSSRHG